MLVALYRLLGVMPGLTMTLAMTLATALVDPMVSATVSLPSGLSWRVDAVEWPHRENTSPGVQLSSPVGPAGSVVPPVCVPPLRSVLITNCEQYVTLYTEKNFGFRKFVSASVSERNVGVVKRRVVMVKKYKLNFYKLFERRSNLRVNEYLIEMAM